MSNSGSKGKKREIDVLVLSDSDDETPASSSSSSQKKRAPPRDTAAATTAAADDDEAEYQRQLALAMAESLAAVEPSEGVASGGASQSGATASRSSGATSREQMEKERLARQRAREEENGGALKPAYKVQPAVKRPRVGTIADVTTDSAPSTGAVASSSSNFVHGFASTSAPAPPASGAVSPAKNRHAERYWNGALHRVSSRYVPDSTSFSFDDALGPKADIKTAIVGAYVMDVEWVCERLGGDFPVMLVTPTHSKENLKGEIAQVIPEVRLNTFQCSPRMQQLFSGYYGTMHVKCLILYFEDFCRIIIPTANSVDYDWDRIDNALYIHDFPSRPFDAISSESPKSPWANGTHTSFTKNLFKYMEALGVRPRFSNPLQRYDFSSSNKVQLVTSRNGWATGWDDIEKSGGLTSLAKGVKALGISSGGYWEIECTGSSYGKLDDNFLRQFLAACQGIEPREYFTAKCKSPPNLPMGPRSGLPIKLIFPTLASVDGSFGGRPGGGTLFFPSKFWDKSDWPGRKLMHQGISKRQGVIAHTKHIVALHKPGPNPPADFKHEGWIYTGSHNFTTAAWGSLSQQVGQQARLQLANWEMGCIIKIEGATEAEVERKASELATYVRPLRPYGKNDVPWQQEKYMDDA
ncbi:tyrosyl-DNA phosphodiesterase 1 [Pseudohyphozyma bogoriensis]|nr:tyrosyl-DNA phosphodiesterase 1 [Pseudohyphozyma bogoriensis]